MVSMEEYFSRENTKISDLINEKQTTIDYPRHYLGMSQLGEECWRKLWYYFRWCAKEKIDGRVNRIFRTGHEAEEFMIKDLELIGIKTWDTLNNQDSFYAVSKHCVGHSDGKANNIPGAEKTDHLLEFKTSSQKYFSQIVKNGVQIAKPLHYAQMCLYMYFGKLTRALYVVYNKNDSDYYMERIKCNNSYAKELIEKAEAIITCEDVDQFQKIGNGTPTYFACSFCNFGGICHFKAKPLKSCRTCTSANILDDGKWGCGLQNDKILSIEDQKNACANYNLLDCLSE